jgi:hypothetical protein
MREILPMLAAVGLALVVALSLNSAFAAVAADIGAASAPR